ncbi:MAG: flavin monoamine oxidase family protein [Rhodospirillales bacterium]
MLALIGQAGGAGVMYQAMSTLGFAAESGYRGPLKLSGAPAGASVLVLGAGIAGLVAALELRSAGYKVQVLEYNDKAGGRCWTLRGGDRYTELGGAAQHCEFDPGLYINPGPWRIPYHHHAMLDYCHRLGVTLEPFIQVNYNAMVHSSKEYGGKPQRFRHVQADFQGHIAELLGKAVQAKRLDQAMTPEDTESLLAALKDWGALDKDYRYVKSAATSLRRGFEVDAGGGLMPLAKPSTPLDAQELIKSGLWQSLSVGNDYDFHSSIFQPVGGMDMIARAFQRELAGVIRFGAKVTEIHQDERGVTARFVDAKTSGASGTSETVRADWCVCALPLSILSQIPLNVSRPMEEAIHAVPYDAAVKIGLQMKRRFWEQDERIYGGITYTDMPIQRIGYPSTDFGKPGKGVLLGAYIFGANAFEVTAMPPAERVKFALSHGAQIHPQYAQEFETGVAVGWHRVPWTNGCYGMWNDDSRAAHYDNLCQIDGRIVLAGEHASYIPAWQEGAALSSLDAIRRLHAKILESPRKVS